MLHQIPKGTGLSSGTKSVGPEVTHRPPSSGEVKNERSYVSTPTIRLDGADRDFNSIKFHKTHVQYLPRWKMRSVRQTDRQNIGQKIKSKCVHLVFENPKFRDSGTRTIKRSSFFKGWSRSGRWQKLWQVAGVTLCVRSVMYVTFLITAEAHINSSGILAYRGQKNLRY